MRGGRASDRYDILYTVGGEGSGLSEVASPGAHFRFAGANGQPGSGPASLGFHASRVSGLSSKNSKVSVLDAVKTSFRL